MKKAKTIGKKTLSVFLAVLMVLTAWVWVAPTEAEAVNGSYYVKVTYNVTNEGTLESAYNGKTEQNDSAGITLTYARDNGRSSTTGVKNWDIKSNVATKKNGYEATATVAGFPIELYASVNDNTWATTTIEIVKLECGSSSSNLKTLWTGVMRLSSSSNWKHRTLKSDGTSTGTNDTSVTNGNATGWIYPYVPSANSISATTAVADIGIPPLGDEKDTKISTRSIQYYATDYYGVRYEPTSYSVTGVSGLTTGTGWSCGSAYPITATTSTTKSTVGISQTATVTMNWNNGKSTTGQKANTTATFQVYNPRYKVTFNGNGGTLGTNYTYAYYGRAINHSTSTATSNNVEGLTAELFPTTGIKEGYTFGGMYTAATGGSKISATQTVSADTTYYAHWDINNYTATFYGTKANDSGTGTVEYVVSTSTVPYNTKPTAPTTVDGYSLGDYDYTFDSWDNEIANIGVNGAEYRATYTSTFVPADYGAVNDIVAEANAIINSDTYEAIYNEESRQALENAVNSVVYNQGRTNQSVVDAYVPMIREAIDGLGRQKYSVLFIDGVDNSIIELRYPVYYGDAITLPTAPTRGFTTTEHYVFKEWTPSENGDNMNFVSKNMIIIANYDKVVHTYTDTPLSSNCTTQAGVLHKCSCGYEYVEYSGSVGTEHNLETEWTVDIAPTCTTVGSKSHHCTRCSYRADVTEIPALDHDFTNGYQGVVINPGCENDGAEVSECQRCGYDKYTLLPQSGHKWKETVVAPTCTSSGYTIKTCENCGDEDVVSFTDPIVHTYVENADEYVAPTCTGLGKKVSYCSCGAQKVETVSATGHKWNTAPTTDFEATCTTKGQQSIHCSVCNVISEESITEIPEKGHTWGKEICEQQESCGIKGLYVKTCSVCQENSSRIVAALTHNYISEVVDPTCTTKGYTVETCDNCGDVRYTNETPALNHAWTSTTHAADCTHSAYIEHICGNDSTHNYVEYVSGSAALTHDFTGTETIISNATCEADGKKTVQCTRCDAVNEVIIPKLGHSYGAWVVEKEATNTEKGLLSRTCINGCGKKETAEIPAGGHSFNTDEPSATTDGTCLVKGTKTFKCSAHSDCGVTITVETEFGAHAWSDWTKVDATNDTDGSWTRECSVCHTKEAHVIPKGDHKFGDTPSSTVPATCKKTGTATYNCTTHTNCGVTITVVLEMIQHTAGVDKKDATCTENGYVKTYCTVCGDVISNVELKKTGHVETTTTRQESTCVTPGWEKVICKCGELVSEKELPLIAHNYDANGDGKVDKKDAVFEDGTYTYTCQQAGCGHTITEDADDVYKVRFFDAAGNQIGETQNVRFGESAVAPAAPEKKADGTYHYEFSVWDRNYSEITSDLDVYPTYEKELHYGGEATCKDKALCDKCGTAYGGYDDTKHVMASKSTPATCEKDGVINYYCTLNCGYGYSEKIQKLNHNYGEWTVVQQGTCVKEHIQSRKCQNYGCDATEEYSTYKNHSWILEPAIAPTCTTVGYTEFKYCTVCNLQLDRQEVAKLSHNDRDGNGYCDYCGTSQGVPKCNCMCHSTGFMKIIYSIVRFFWIITKSSPSCSCGARHY